MGGLRHTRTAGTGAAGRARIRQDRIIRIVSVRLSVQISRIVAEAGVGEITNFALLKTERGAGPI